VIAYHATIGHIDVVQVVESTSPSNVPDWLRYIYIQVVFFKLAVVCRGYWQHLIKGCTIIDKKEGAPRSKAHLKVLGLGWNERRGHVSGKVTGLLGPDTGHLVLRICD